MVAFSKLSIAAGAMLASLAAAHPGESHSAHHMKREFVARDHQARNAARSLGACANSAASRELKARAVQRRADTVKNLRQKRGINAPAKKQHNKAKRDLTDLQAWELVNHNMTGIENKGIFTDLDVVFDANTSCVLAPEDTDGPYYVAGEYHRSNVIEAEYSEGVNLFLEVQYVDVNDCSAVPGIAVDVWNCNATGVYSGVESGQAGYNTTFLRGVQLTDHDGVVQFETIFPGHYEGRATHTHLLSHTNATLEPNGTISIWDAAVNHIGQLFWDETLRSAVEATYPYNTNTVDVTTNDEDMWSVVQADSSYDPFPEWLYLGDDVSDGLFAWIQIGINTSADYSESSYYSVAAYLGDDGGHAYSGSTFTGGATKA